MKRYRGFLFTFLAVLLLTLLLWGCLATSTASSTSPTTSGSSAASSSQASSAATDQESGAAITQASMIANNAKTHEGAGDYDIDPGTTAPIIFEGDSITASGTGIRVSGATVTITAPGDYRLSGSLNDGQVVVDSQLKGSVRLILDGVILNSSTSAPLYIKDANKVILILADGSQNAISDAASYTFPAPDVDEPNAAIFSKADLSIAGSGTLTVNASYNDGITSKDGLIIAGGSITVTSVDDGIRGKDYLIIEGGALTVNAQGDGLKSDNAEDPAKGYLSVTSGTLAVTSGGDALSAHTTAAVTGGALTLTTGGGAGQVVADTESAKGIKGGTAVVTDGGTFSINAADDALHSNGSITINDGSFILASADDAVHADQALTLNGGEIQVTGSYEGLESAAITINGGTMRIVSSDDGVNVAGGVDGSGMLRGPGGMGGGSGQDAAAYTGSLHLDIHGGYLFVDAQGDGIDVGGAIEMTGGVVLVVGPSEQMNGPLDYDAGFNMTGGFMVATGSAGMAMTAGQYSTQNTVLVYLAGTQPGGTPLAVLDSDGKVVFTFTPTRDYQSIAFSSAELATGQSYTVYTGGSVSGASTDGYTEDGSYTPGTQAAVFAISSVVTQSGTGGMGPGGRPSRGPRP